MSQKRAAAAATTIFIYLLSSHKHYYCRVHGQGHCRSCCINGASIHIERSLDFHNNDTVRTYIRLGTVFSNKKNISRSVSRAPVGSALLPLPRHAAGSAPLPPPCDPRPAPRHQAPPLESRLPPAPALIAIAGTAVLIITSPCS